MAFLKVYFHLNRGYYEKTIQTEKGEKDSSIFLKGEGKCG
jgi:hypothetical protein